jgi:tryptophan-rich sensory protein
MNRNTAAILAGSAVLAAAILGARQGPQQPHTALWYARLHKPDYTPPGPVIGATWGVLETLLVGTGYRLLRQPNSAPRDKALGAWACSLIGLAVFPFLFFRRKRLGASTVASAAMLAAAAGTAVNAREVDKTAAAMTLPLLGWIGFATILSGDLYRRNG